MVSMFHNCSNLNSSVASDLHLQSRFIYDPKKGCQTYMGKLTARVEIEAWSKYHRAACVAGLPKSVQY